MTSAGLPIGMARRTEGSCSTPVPASMNLSQKGAALCVTILMRVTQQCCNARMAVSILPSRRVRSRRIGTPKITLSDAVVLLPT